MYILKYRYYLGIQLLQWRYIYIQSTWCLHWWFLLLDCQVAFWLTRQFQWNSFSKWKCKFQSTVPAQVHPYAQVLAMFAFDSYSQSKRSPRPLSEHRPCKTPFPIGNASFNKPWPNYHGSFMFYSFLIESHRNAGFQRAFFRGHCWRPQTKTRSRPFS